MASQALIQSIPPSQDTLFLRGFSARRKIEDIREFFERESGERCIVQFHKEDEFGEHLFVALKFETKEGARDILDRFDNQEVFKDRIGISWYRDMRKARMMGGYGHGPPGRGGGGPRHYQGGGGGWNNDYFGGPGGRGGYDGPPPKRRPPPLHPHPPHQLRSSYQKRSRRESSSRSRSRSSDDDRDSRSRSRDRSSDSRHRSESRSISRDRSRDEFSSGESSPERKSPKVKSSKSKDKKKKKSDKSSRKKSREPHSASKDGDNEENEEDGIPYENDDNNLEEGDQMGDPYESPERVNGGDKQVIRSAVHKTPAAAGSKSEGKEAGVSAKSSQIATQGISSEQQAMDVLSNNPIAGGSKHDPSGPSPVKDQRKPDSQFLPLEEELRSVKRVIKRVPNADSAESVGKMRSRGEPDFYGGEQQRFASDVVTTRHSRLVDEFEMESHRPPPRRSDWGDGATSRLSNDWDRNASTMFDFLADQVPPTTDKPTMIREKKVEIEKCFRQDCETLTSVVKLLVSKDPDLESRLQFSLRENLKDIGQRCIQELREFIEGVNNK